MFSPHISLFNLSIFINEVFAMFKKTFFTIFTSVFFLLIILQGNGFAGTVELTFAHFMPEKHVQHRMVMEPWTRKMEKLSNGRLKITIHPRGILGKAADQYDNVIKGTFDIAFGLHSYTPDRFPLTSVLDLPFLVNNAEKGSLVLWQVYEKFLQEELKDTKILWMFTHSPGQIHTRKKHVKTLEDMKGLRLTCSGPIIAKALERLGAIPMPMPITKCYAAIKNNAADGIAIPFDGMIPFKFYKQCKYHTVANLYTTTFFVAMNKQKYESLPADLKKLMDENTGEEMSALAGRVYEESGSKTGREFIEKNGGKIFELPLDEHERWRIAAMSVGDEWIKELEGKGLPGQRVLSYVVDLLIQLR
jgi:TRAP-type transport system periplasmic protein